MILLIHSPLLGPYSWDAVARLLRAAGHDVAVPDLRPALAGPPPYLPRLHEAAAAATGGHSASLVAHSAAGPLLPAVADLLGPAAERTILVDARLPHPGSSWLASLEAGRADRLRGMADKGQLPPWDAWFPAEALADEIPDAGVREQFRAELQPTPLALYEEQAPGRGSVFDRLAHTYVRLSPAYDEAAGTAERAGWRVLRRTAGHLVLLSTPAEIAAIIDDEITGADVVADP